jgi:hypothetical protein
VGLVVAVGLSAIGALVPDQSDAFRRGFGRIMASAHGLVAFATVYLIGQAWRVAEAERPLAERRRRRAGDDELGPLVAVPGEPEASRAAIDRQARELSDRQEESRRIGQFVAAIVPAIGFAAAIWHAPADSRSLAGQPLFLGLGEAFFVLLLHLGVSHSAEVLKAGWLGLSPKAAASDHDPFGPRAFVDPLATL